MTDLLARVRDFYVAPPAPAAPRAGTLAPAPALAVLGPGRESAPAAAVLALTLARSGGWPCALVAVWPGGQAPAWQLPARPAARRLAARLNGQQLEARAGGRLVHLVLPDPSAAAAAALERATGAVRGPVAVALAGPRDSEIDALLRLQDVIVLLALPGDDPAVSRMACASLSSLRAPAVTCEAAPGAAARALALAGACAPGGLRRALYPALEVTA